MTPEQQCAFIIAQTACAMADIAAMQLENTVALAAGLAPVHSGQDFRDIALRYGIHHNAVIGFFR